MDKKPPLDTSTGTLRQAQDIAQSTASFKNQAQRAFRFKSKMGISLTTMNTMLCTKCTKVPEATHIYRTPKRPTYQVIEQQGKILKGYNNL